MFEKLLEKILQSVIGNYISGIDANNLHMGIWSIQYKQFIIQIKDGDIKIENVEFKQEALAQLELPLKLKNSFVGKLIIKINWRLLFNGKLTTTPIEILLEDIFLLLSPIEQAEWQFVDYNDCQKKEQLITTFANSFLQKIIQKQESISQSQSKQEMTMLDKVNLLIKIFQIKKQVENENFGQCINILERVNDSQQFIYSNELFASGISLEELSIFTTNEKWEAQFIDRLLPENQNMPIRKLVCLKNLSLYWHVFEQNQQVQSLNEKNFQINMREQLQQNQNSIIKLNIQANFSQNLQDGKYLKPVNDVAISIQEVYVKLQKQQLQSIISLSELLGNFQKELQLRKKVKIRQKINNETQRQYKINFMLMVDNCHHLLKRNLVIDFKQQLSQQDYQQFQQIIANCNTESLYKWIKIVIKKAEQDKQLNASLKQSQKKGIFGSIKSLWMKDDDDQNTLKIEQQKFDDFYKENFSDEQLEVKHQPLEYVETIIQFSLLQCIIRLSKNIQQNSNEQNEEGVFLIINQIQSQIQLRAQNMEITSSITDINLELAEYINQPLQNKQIKFLQKVISNENNNLIEMKYIKKPLNQPSDQKEVDSAVYININQIYLHFNPLFHTRLSQIFTLQANDNLKDIAWEKIEKTYDNVSEQVITQIESKNFMFLDIFIQSPIIIIPFSYEDITQQKEAWGIFLGNISIKTPYTIISQDMQSKNYDNYDISIQQIKFNHYINYNELYQSNQLEPNFSLLNEFQLNLEIYMLKSSVSQQNNAKSTIQINIPMLDLKISKDIYEKLIDIGNCFQIPSQQNQIQIETEEEKLKLEQNCAIKGVIYKQNKFYQWEKFYGILSGNYIYLYNSSKSNENKEYFYIKNSQIILYSKEQSGRNNSFIVQTRYGTSYFSVDSQIQNWINKIQAVRSEEEDDTESIADSQQSQDSFLNRISIEKEQKQLKQNIISCNILQQCIKLSIKKINFSIIDQESIWLQVQAGQLTFKQDKYSLSNEIEISLQNIKIEDYLTIFKDSSIKNFLDSQSDDINPFIYIQLKQMQKEHPKYEYIDNNIKFIINAITINYKPNTFLKILKFTKIQKISQQQFTNQNDYEDEDQVDKQILDQTKDHKKKQFLSLQNDQLNKKSLTQEKQQQELIQAKTQIVVKQINLILVNQKSNIKCNKILVQDLQCHQIAKYSGIEILASLKNFQIFDLTNYPNTIFNEEMSEEVMQQERQMFGASYSNQTFLKMNINLFDKDSLQFKNSNVGIQIQLNFSEILIDFINQPLMRLIDYLMTQILAILNHPSLLSQEQIQEIYYNKKFVNYSKLYVLNEFLKKPNFMDLKLEMQQIKIEIKEEMLNNDYLFVKLKQIQIETKRSYNESRIIYKHQTQKKQSYNIEDQLTEKKSTCRITEIQEEQEYQLKNILCDNYCIKLQGFQLFTNQNNQQKQISLPFDFEIQMEKPLFIDEYKFVYSNVLSNIEDYTYFQCHLSHFILFIEHKDFLLIMKSLNGNISYDDACDQYLLGQQILINEDNEIKQNQEVDKNNKQLDFNLKMDKIILYMVNLKELPFSKISLENIQLNFSKFQNDNKEIHIQGKKLTGNYYQDNKENVLKGALFGKFKNQKQLLDKKCILQEECNQDLKISQNLVQNQKKNMIDFKLLIKGNGFKQIQISQNNLLMNIHICTLIQIISFIQMDYSVIPRDPVGLTVEQLLEYKKDPGKGMNIQIKCENIMLNFGGNFFDELYLNQGQTVLLKGDVNLLLDNFPFKNIKEHSKIQTEISNKYDEDIKNAKLQEDKDDLEYQKQENIKDINKLQFMQISLKNFQAYFCPADELQSISMKKFKSLYKRNIILPFHVNLEKKQYVVVQTRDKNFLQQMNPNFKEDVNQFFAKQETIIEMENKIAIRISFKDIQIFQTIFDYQLNQKFQNFNEQELKEEEKKKLQFEQEEKVLNQAISNVEGAIIDLNDVSNKILIAGIQTLIIDDFNESLYPCLEIEFNDFELIQQQSILHNNIKSLFAIKSSYFNCSNSRWEPVLENTTLEMHLSQNTRTRPFFILSLQLDSECEIMNICISTQMIQTIYRIQNELQIKEIQKRRQCKSNSFLQAKSHLQQQKKKQQQVKEDGDIKNKINLRKQKSTLLKTLEKNIFQQKLDCIQNDTFQEMNNDENIEFVSPYIIYNETGYDIEVYRDYNENQQKSMSLEALKKSKDQKILIGNGLWTSIEVENDIEQMFLQIEETDMQNIYLVNVKINSVRNNLIPIQHLSLDRLGVKRIQLQSQKGYFQQKQKQINSNIICTVDIQNNKKIMTLSSQLIFLSKINHNIQIKFDLPTQDSSFMIDLESGGSYPIPCDISACQIQFRLKIEEEFSDWSLLYEVSKLLLCSHDSSFEIAINANQKPKHYMILHIQKDQMGLGKTLVYFEAPFYVKNCLPLPLKIRIYVEQEQKEIANELDIEEYLEINLETNLETNNKFGAKNRHDLKIYLEIEILPQEDINFTQFSTKQKLLFSLQSQNTEWSQLYLLYKQNSSPSDLIYLPSKKWNENVLQQDVQILLHHLESFIGIKQFFFYASAYIINQTPYDLIFWIDDINSSILNNEDDYTSFEDIINDLSIKSRKLVGGQWNNKENNNIIIVPPNITQIKIGIRNDMYSNSEQLILEGIQEQRIYLSTSINPNSMELQKKIKDIDNLNTLVFGCKKQLLRMDEFEFIFCKKIQIIPGYIIINNIENPIYILHSNLDEKNIKSEEIIIIQPQSRAPFFWQKTYFSKIKENSKLIKMNVGQDYCFSGDLPIDSLGQLYFSLKHKTNNEFVNIKLEVNQLNGILYVSFFQLENDQAYIFKNTLENVSISIKQKINESLLQENYQDFQFYERIVDRNSQIPFAWDQPTQEKKIELTFYNSQKLIKFQEIEQKINEDQKLNQLKIKSRIKFSRHRKNQSSSSQLYISEKPQGFSIVLDSIDKINYAQIFQIPSDIIDKEQENEFLDVQIKINAVGQTKVVMLEKIMQQNNEQKDNLDQDQTLSLIIKQIGVSIIENHQSLNKNQTQVMTTKELIYITINQLQMCKIVQSNKTELIQLKIKFMNIDHNSQFNAVYPVILTVSDSLKSYTQNSKKYFINALLTKGISSASITLFHSIKIELEPLTIRIEQNFINDVLNFYKNLGFTQELTIEDLMEKQQIDKYFWQHQEIGQIGVPIYIDEIILSPLELNTTFKMNTSSTDFDAFILFKMVIKALGLAITNIDNAPIKLKGIYLTKCYDSLDGILEKLKQHYKHNIMSEILKVIGSLAIVGNPVGLFNNIGEGIKDLLEKPKEGFIKGPLEGSLGLAEGAGSLIKNTISGAFNSVNKITGSLATGLSSLSEDFEYLQKREKLKNKNAQHLGQGLILSGEIIFQGFYQGLTGIYLKPKEGVEKNGFLGFLQGSGQGVLGLFAKPLTGILDAVSKTAEGIKNTATYLDEKTNELRIRQPRVFYVKLFIIQLIFWERGQKNFIECIIMRILNCGDIFKSNNLV